MLDWRYKLDDLDQYPVLEDKDFRAGHQCEIVSKTVKITVN